MAEVYWEDLLDATGKDLVRIAGADPDWLPDDHNPITSALRSGVFLGENKIAICRAATACQMKIFDRIGGPEEDGQPKALRRHWYAWFKSELAQPLAQQFKENLDDKRTNTYWSARLSEVYAEMVDSGAVTYKQLWVSDESRKAEQNWNELYRRANILLCVEKDSLLADFVAASKAIGAKSIYSGKGKSSKAAMELVLREHFGWSEWHSPFSEDNPLVILHVSDYDFDGRQVIGPTFGDQARRYTPHIEEMRVGVEPIQVKLAGYNWQDKWYVIKVTNTAYQDWAKEYALFIYTCPECEETNLLTRWVAISNQSDCPECGAHLIIEDVKEHAFGFEVEALKVREYYGLVAEALLQVIPFQKIITKLRDECQADPRRAARQITSEIAGQNPRYRRLVEAIDKLEQIRDAFEERIQSPLVEAAEPRVDDWRDLEDDPTEEDFIAYVEAANKWSEPWRPFSVSLRTTELADWLLEQSDLIDELSSYDIIEG